MANKKVNTEERGEIERGKRRDLEGETGVEVLLFVQELDALRIIFKIRVFHDL